jgi:hypothetical protein
LLLAGCSGRIWTDEATPGSVKLHWYTTEQTIEAANAEADAHCRMFGAHAVLVGEFLDQDITRAEYECG